jgi:hypothetical protein
MGEWKGLPSKRCVIKLLHQESQTTQEGLQDYKMKKIKA